MALRVRLTPPPPEQSGWNWHKANCGPVPSSVLLGGARRMEAEAYLTGGYKIRINIERQLCGWGRLGDFARVWQPSRLKGVLVPENHGTSFLAATQVFDLRPIPRKWLAEEKTSSANDRFVQEGTIFVTCSGTVGQSTIASESLNGILISHDILRCNANLPEDNGWIYAFLRTPQAKAMMVSAKYGQVIKHLEVEHLSALPIPTVDAATTAYFAHRVACVIARRNDAYRLTLEAEKLFEQALGIFQENNQKKQGFSVKSSDFFSGRRRLEAATHSPQIKCIRRYLKDNGSGFTKIDEAGYVVWLPTRFRRIPATDGIFLVESADITEVNPEFNKRIADVDFGDPYKGRIEAGWILMARSGQTYGIIGTAVLAGKNLEGKVVSDDVMRIKKLNDVNSNLRSGYLVTALSHPMLGQPLIKALSYGSSIPHIDPTDMSQYEVVRLKEVDEFAIADLAEASAQARAEADILERQITEDATKIVDFFIAHGSFDFNTFRTFTKKHDLATLYSIQDKNSVKEILVQIPEMTNLLVDANSKILSLFGPQTKLSLHVVDEGKEFDVPSELVVKITSVHSFEKSQELLTRFDEEWWLDAMQKGHHRVTISLNVSGA